MSVAVLGSINMDVVLSVPAIPKPGETLSATKKTLHPGGKGANQAIAAARAGAPTVLIGAVGDDQFGKDLIANLNDNVVDVTCVETWNNTDTGQAYINVANNGENNIVVVPGANYIFAYPLKEPDQVSAAKIRLSQLEMPIAAIRAFFLSARKDPGVLCILNAAPALNEAKGLFSFCDIIIVNETELEVFSEALFDTQAKSELVSAARTLMTRPGQKVVVTLGAVGSLLVTADTEFEVPACPAKTVDTTGAGDCFCGVLAAGLSVGKPIEKALKLASAAASLAVEKEGAGTSMPMQSSILDRVSWGQSGRSQSDTISELESLRKLR